MGRTDFGWRQACVAGLLLVLCAVVRADSEARYAEQRAALMREIEHDAQRTAFETGRAQFSPRVMQVLSELPRHRFVPENQQAHAYENRPLPIGHGQTISQPYIVALMTDLLQPQPEHRVLEIGTGSGYQAAVLARLVRQVYTIEIIEPLGREAAERLRELKFSNVTTRMGDGYYGWLEHAPFDSIVVTAAAGSVPPPLIAQLKPGGRMVIPVGGPFFTQELLLIKKREDGSLRTEHVLPVRFVPLTGEH